MISIISQLKKQIMHCLIANLKKRKRCILRKFDIPISMNLLSKLKSMYEINGRFKINNLFQDDFIKVNRNYRDLNQYTEIIDGLIEFKVSNPKKSKYGYLVNGTYHEEIIKEIYGKLNIKFHVINGNQE